MDKISCIIPTRNRWDMLRFRAILSILNQTYENLELIIVDDGSDTSITEPYLSFYMDLVEGELDSRIELYRIEKTYPYPKDDKKAEWLAGPCLALNEALKHVTGDWIYRCDDDDILEPDCLESLLKFVTEGKYDFVSALWKDKDNLIGMPSLIYTYEIGGVQTWLYKAEYKNILYDPCCWKKKWNANNEWDWFERFIKAKPYPHNKKIGFIPKVVCTILPRPGCTEIGSKAL